MNNNNNSDEYIRQMNAYNNLYHAMQQQQYHQHPIHQQYPQNQFSQYIQQQQEQQISLQHQLSQYQQQEISIFINVYFKNLVSQQNQNELQLKILNIFVQQNQMLLDYKKKNEDQQEMLNQLIDEIYLLQKQLISSNNFSFQSSRFLNPSQNNILLKAVYGTKEITTNFQQNLILENDVEMPLYKDKSFNLDITLKDQQGAIIKNKDKIDLTVKLFTSDSTPVQLTNNQLGQPILKINDNQMQLVSGKALLTKLQISEVTSHFQNGWIYLVISPKNKKQDSESEQLTIRPLVLQVIVKSKRSQTKKKQMSSESNSPSMQSRSRSRSMSESDSGSKSRSKSKSKFKIFQNDQSQNNIKNEYSEEKVLKQENE